MTTPLYIALLHEGMLDKNGDRVTTSLTLIDMHDFCRAAKTYGAKQVFIAHPSGTMRKLANILQGHWREGYGSHYNTDRKTAISILSIVSDLESIVEAVLDEHGTAPRLIATSAKSGDGRIPYSQLREELNGGQGAPIVLLFGTGWGMSEELLSRTDGILAPIDGPGSYNHLSVRTACAIILDRLTGRFE